MTGCSTEVQEIIATSNFLSYITITNYITYQLSPLPIISLTNYTYKLYNLPIISPLPIIALTNYITYELYHLRIILLNYITLSNYITYQSSPLPIILTNYITLIKTLSLTCHSNVSSVSHEASEALEFVEL